MTSATDADPKALTARRTTSLHACGPRWLAGWFLACAIVAPHSATADFSCPPGFSVELVYAVPLAAQGSWVRMTMGPAGVVITSDERGKLYRVRPGATAAETSVAPLGVDLGEAQGLVFAHGSLYAVVSHAERYTSGLYRLRYDEQSDSFTPPELLHAFGGGGENGPHGVALGPDGMLYVVAGYQCPHPVSPAEGPVAPFLSMAERSLFQPLLDPVDPPSPEAHTTGGWIARTDADGKRWELCCVGLQNPYDLAFDSEGDAFTADSDMEWEQGTSWYRPSRVLHACSAADFGWRPGSGKYPVHFIDTLPPVVDVGRGSPTGLAFGHGTAFPEPYRRALFVGDWTYGRIYAVHLQSEGSSYKGRFEVFVARKPMAITDVKAHEDGCLYFLVGGRQTQSALHRVRYRGEAPPDAVPLNADPPECREARGIRRRLEMLHVPVAADAPGDDIDARVELAWRHLRSRDRHIRHAARITLEHVAPDHWRDRALSEPSSPAALEAILALLQTGTPQPPWFERALARLGEIEPSGLTLEELRDLVRVTTVALSGARFPPPRDSATVDRLRQTIAAVEALERGSDGADTVELQAFLGDAQAVTRGADRLLADASQERQFGLAMALRRAVGLLPPSRQRAYFTWLDAAEHDFAGGDRLVAFLRLLRQDALSRLPPDARRFATDARGAAAPGVGAIKRTTRQFVHNWQYEFLEDRLGETDRGRSFADGKLALAEASCLTCHRFRGEGGDVGPDLTLIGRRFDKKHILASIIRPDEVIADRYEKALVVTRDGTTREGRIVARSDSFIELQPRPLDRGTIRLAAPDVASVDRSPRSDMPTGLLNILTQSEVLNLIAYLVSEGNEDDPCFSP